MWPFSKPNSPTYDPETSAHLASILSNELSSGNVVRDRYVNEFGKCKLLIVLKAPFCERYDLKSVHRFENHDGHYPVGVGYQDSNSFDIIMAPNGSRFLTGHPALPTPAPIPFRVRPGYQSADLLVEVMDDHRREGFPNVASILRDSLQAARAAHPDNMDDMGIAASQDRFFSYWVYPGGEYEIDDDWGGLFITAKYNNQSVINDVECALVASGKFLKHAVDFEQFR